METPQATYQIVLATAGSDEQARSIARALVERRLAACVNIVPLGCSIYRWRGRIEQEEERLLLIKSARHLLHVPIATLESSLDPQMFLRIHRSLIVNVKHVQELETGPHGEYIVVLQGGAKLQSSRSYHEKIKAWASNPF